jgi:hypothetical protein
VTNDDSEQARLDNIGGASGDDGAVGETPNRPNSTGNRSEEAGNRSEDAGSRSEDAGSRSDTDARARGVTGDIAETVEVGVALLAHLEDRELSLAAAVDRIETVTTDPAVTREILDTAELRGVIDREDGIVRPRSGAFVSFERDVVRREGEFTCKRCGAALSTGYFVTFDAGEHGPFGSSCIRKVTGRE